jgi:hypothetical protein
MNINGFKHLRTTCSSVNYRERVYQLCSLVVCNKGIFWFLDVSHRLLLNSLEELRKIHDILSKLVSSKHVMAEERVMC